MMDAMVRLELPDRDNLGEHFVDRHIDDGRGDKTAIISGDQRVTYAESPTRSTVLEMGYALLDDKRNNEY